MRDTVRRFLELNLVLAGENDFERLLPRMLKELTIAADARAGVLYLASVRGDALVPGVLRIGERTRRDPPLPELPLANVPRLLADAIAAGRPRPGAWAPMISADRLNALRRIRRVGRAAVQPAGRDTWSACCCCFSEGAWNRRGRASSPHSPPAPRCRWRRANWCAPEGAARGPHPADRRRDRRARARTPAATASACRS